MINGKYSWSPFPVTRQKIYTEKLSSFSLEFKTPLALQIVHVDLEEG